MSSSTDLSVFNNNQQPDKNCNNFKTCISVNRLLHALKYYSALKILVNTENQDIFVHFIKEVYGIQLLDDYNHFSELHDHELENILKYAKSSGNVKNCDLEYCDYSNRRYGVNIHESISNLNTSDHDLCFYIDIMDSFHFHLMHLYDAALRISKEDISFDDAEIKKDSEYFDAELSRQHAIISSKRSGYARFERINNTHSSKFVIKSDDQYVDKNGKALTTLQLIALQLIKKPYNITREPIIQLDEFVVDQEYDTEAVQLDLQLNGSDGNIFACTSLKCANALLRIFTMSRSMWVYICMYIRRFPSIYFGFNIFQYLQSHLVHLVLVFNLIIKWRRSQKIHITISRRKC